MHGILAGFDTEFGLWIEGRGAEDQIEDATALVRAFPGECLAMWDYKYESPRADLRGFQLKRLAVDPEDAKFDSGRAPASHDLRADRILPNGSRFYNDHGHPELATPECRSLNELVRQDLIGCDVVIRAAKALQDESGRKVVVYKNNTDFHGASWGSHESYLAPRRLGFEQLFRDVLPMLVVRQVLVGAGKVGAESGPAATYQISQRADFFVEPANAETLFRRPIFNTRDEPHAARSDWIRLHVICGDSNMIASSTKRKAGLVKLALKLCEEGSAPLWKMKDPVRAFQEISRDETYAFRVELDRKSWTTAHLILESYFAAAEATLELDEDDRWTIDNSRRLLSDLETDWDSFRREVDWAAKRAMFEHYMDEQGTDWRDESLRSFDLEYSNLEPEDSLHSALVDMDEVVPNPPLTPTEEPERTRAWARSLAVTKFGRSLANACWRSLTFSVGDQAMEVQLPPNGSFPQELELANDVESFIQILRGVE